MDNPYNLLGVEKEASDKAIKASYRALAKKHHPDINPGDKASEEKFKKISAAYELLSDKKKRAAYDNGEIDQEGQPTHQQKHYNDYANSPGGQRYHRHTNLNQDDLDDLLKNMFRGNPQSAPFSGFEQENLDTHYSIDIEFTDAVHGAKKTIQIPNDKKLTISIPKGIKDGQKLRLKGKGVSPKGDAYIEVHIRRHAFFERKGNDIYVDIPISIDESILGKEIHVPTIHGAVKMRLPKGINSGTVMRVKGKGLQNGDQFVNLKIVMPKVIDSELETLIQTWAKTHSYNPRKHLENVS